MTKGEMILGVTSGAMALAALGAGVMLSRRVKIATPSWKSGKEWMENSWLAGLPSTNFKIVTTVVLYFLTFAAWAAAVLLEKPVDELTFGLWLGFLAGLGGFALAQFSKQRASDYGALERQAEIERAKRGVGPSKLTEVQVDVTAPAADAAAPPKTGEPG